MFRKLRVRMVQTAAERTAVTAEKTAAASQSPSPILPNRNSADRSCDVIQRSTISSFAKYYGPMTFAQICDLEHQDMAASIGKANAS